MDCGVKGLLSTHTPSVLTDRIKQSLTRDTGAVASLVLPAVFLILNT